MLQLSFVFLQDHKMLVLIFVGNLAQISYWQVIFLMIRSSQFNLTKGMRLIVAFSPSHFWHVSPSQQLKRCVFKPQKLSFCVQKKSLSEASCSSRSSLAST